MKNKFIVIEGLGGSGKTVISKKLAEILGGSYYKAPLEPFSILREYVNKSTNPQTRTLYYLMSISHLSDIVEKNISKSSIIVDKYIYTTIAFNKAKGVEVEIPKFLSLKKPDYMFFLDVDDNIRAQRLSIRNNETFIRDETVVKKDKKVMDVYKKFPFIKIDNNNSVDESIKQILDVIKKS